MDNEEKEVLEEEVEETKEEETQTEETTTEETKKEEKTEGEKPKRTPQEELDYFEGRAARLRKDLGLDNQPKETSKSKKSSELDYGAKAYLSANGIKGSKEFDFVKNELKTSGQDLDSLLENAYFQDRLSKFREINKTSEATPLSKRSGGVPTDTVEYWANKPIEEVPTEMRAKVVNYKLTKDKTKGVFYNS